MAEYIDKKDIRGTGLIFTGEDDMYTSGQADGANKMWNKILSLPTADVIPIPENATNGDMIKAMFSVETVDDFCRSFGVRLNNSNYIQFNKDWWNAPYKREE